MLVKILGAIDVLAGVILIFNLTNHFSQQALLILGIIFLAKSCLGLLKDFASWIDFLTGIFFLLSIIITFPLAISIIIGILILQKGAFSFI